MHLHHDKVVTDPGSGATYTPFVAEDGRVGYHAVREGRATYLYLNPSDTTEDDGVPNVFLYLGRHNDAALDTPLHFYTLVPDDFEVA